VRSRVDPADDVDGDEVDRTAIPLVHLCSGEYGAVLDRAGDQVPAAPLPGGQRAEDS
ncbi:MAG: hypothetical protein QOC82_3250, partial [Frankiaceae bacterium]|nr:hypothetical protein [Frankiaceae bacterium]